MASESSAGGSRVNSVCDFWAYPCNTGSVMMSLYVREPGSRPSWATRVYTESCRRILWPRHNQFSKDNTSAFALLYAVLESAWTNTSFKYMIGTTESMYVFLAWRDEGTGAKM